MKTTEMKQTTISKKAYNGFVDRIQSVFPCDDKDGSEAAVVISMINQYLSGEQPDYESCSDAARIAFLIIKPELEKAAIRSRKAREAAARRKSGKSDLNCKDSAIVPKPAPGDEVCEPATAAKPQQLPVKLNRAERRKLQQKEKREDRRWARHIARQDKAQKDEMRKLITAFTSHDLNFLFP